MLLQLLSTSPKQKMSYINICLFTEIVLEYTQARGICTSHYNKSIVYIITINLLYRF